MNDIAVKDMVWQPVGEAAMEALGGQLGQLMATSPSAFTLFLQGTLGAGKTTLSRGILRALGHRGAVKSPTYTLVETYSLGNRTLHHFDLYRLGDPEELEYLGIRDYLAGDNLCLIEWPERGEGLLPPPDWRLVIEPLPEARRVHLHAETPAGEALLRALWAKTPS